ncbi:MAG: MotA/TolQ/ExbB proton channel family protein [Treponema sp.]|nr:MotA/TolQ/ExbB proton channel family protein [Candidatus Treponema equi]
MNLIEMFNLGGPFMWILLVFSIATFALIIERCIYLFWHDCKVEGLAKNVVGLLEENRKDEAVKMLEQCSRKKTAATIFYALIDNSDFGENRMERAAECEAQERIRRMESGFNYLTALASLAPLTGFLGTVSGMIGAFKSIASATDVNAQLVAGGIYEALITTVFGLIIAIIASIGYNLLVQRVDNFAAETSKAVNDIVPLLLKDKADD